MANENFYRRWKQSEKNAASAWDAYYHLRDRRRYELVAAIAFAIIAVIGWAL